MADARHLSSRLHRARGDRCPVPPSPGPDTSRKFRRARIRMLTWCIVDRRSLIRWQVRCNFFNRYGIRFHQPLLAGCASAAVTRPRSNLRPHFLMFLSRNSLLLLAFNSQFGPSGRRHQHDINEKRGCRSRHRSQHVGVFHSECLGRHRLPGRRLLACARASCISPVRDDCCSSRLLETPDGEDCHPAGKLEPGPTLRLARI